MDILTHTLSGIAVGTVLAGFSKKGFLEKLSIVSLSGFGGAFPDFDAISLWSKFDITVGKLFGLKNTGKGIYSSKFWYSHHAFLHSLFAAFLISLCFGVIIWLIQRKRNQNILVVIKQNKLLLLGFTIGFICHLFEDMPTPAGSWGGVNFFWPLKTYLGGTGKIWWWNNYDIFLIVLTVVFLNLVFLGLGKYLKNKTKIILLAMFVFGVILISNQIRNRHFDFNSIGQTNQFQTNERKSKEIQKEILGVRLYKLMEKFDEKIKVNF